jgi:hypothetical protein
MKGKKKIIITIETWQQSVTTEQPPKLVRCSHCGAEVEMLTPARAAALSKTNERMIFRRIENGELHFTENSEGRILICSGSLAAKNPVEKEQ